jgi:cobalt-zinc-cadmium resistance protein CzcA
MVMDQIAGAHSDLALKIYSDDITESRHIADQVANVLKEIPGAADVAVDQEPPLPQLQKTRTSWRAFPLFDNLTMDCEY